MLETDIAKLFATNNNRIGGFPSVGWVGSDKTHGMVGFYVGGILHRILPQHRATAFSLFLNEWRLGATEKRERIEDEDSKDYQYPANFPKQK